MNKKLEKVSPYLAKSFGISVEALTQCFNPATPDDLNELVQFRQSLFSGDAPWDDKGYLEWRYNLDGADAVKNRMWVFKKESKIVGCLGIEEVVLCAPGVLFTAYKAMDILVDPSLDGRGLGAWMNLYLMSLYPVMIVVGSNDKSHSLIMRLFHQIPHIKTYKLPVHSSRFLQKSLKYTFVSKIAAIPFDLVLYLRRKLQWSKFDRDISIRELSDIPAEIAQFTSGREGMIYVQRSPEYLSWRYLENPRRKFTIIGVYNGNALIGITVCRLFFSESSQQAEATIFDWFYIEDHSGIDNHTLLLQESIKFLISKEAGMVNISAYCRLCHDRIRQLGFIVRNEESSFFLYVRDENIRDQIIDDNKWFLTEGDSDTDMY